MARNALDLIVTEPYADGDVKGVELNERVTRDVNPRIKTLAEKLAGFDREGDELRAKAADFTKADFDKAQGRRVTRVALLREERAIRELLDKEIYPLRSEVRSAFYTHTIREQELAEKFAREALLKAGFVEELGPGGRGARLEMVQL